MTGRSQSLPKSGIQEEFYINNVKFIITQRPEEKNKIESQKNRIY
jgi:hypothetical protein